MLTKYQPDGEGWWTTSRDVLKSQQPGNGPTTSCKTAKNCFYSWVQVWNEQEVNVFTSKLWRGCSMLRSFDKANIVLC